ncbi:DUF2254 domain-containing protein [Ornithinibacillus sp. L9]|uniref:DUF2254 domain-containing protein n=1 Tax=Ornithinibacillus caprae TaxID=2678566 RepID=A0A6N8FJS9_9BACI|nr:DUF2254 domain-containing protein [Ornithinibacillus caprae]
MTRIKVWMIRIRDSFWFVPAIYSFISLILAVVFHHVDEWMVGEGNYKLPRMLVISDEIARGLYTSLVTAILTMTTISFSVIMVVLTTYSSQFSPRTLQDFMQSKVTHHVLGVFCFGFMFALINLVLIGTHDTIIGPILMVIISIFCLAFFIYFIHHAARWLQVSSLIEYIHYDSSRVIKDFFNKKEFGEFEMWDESELRRLKRLPHHVLQAKNAGYIQKIEWQSLVNWARLNDCVIDLRQQIGDYVTKDLPIVTVYSAYDSLELEPIREYIIIGSERTDLEDIEFNIQKLVEIAVKAVSPSINDPDTATDCINRIGSVLTDLGNGFKEIPYLTDKKNDLRVIRKTKPYENYLYKSFYQILYYGKEDVSICYSLLEVLYKMSISSKDYAIRRKIWAFHYYIVNSIDWDSLQDLDRQHVESIYRKLKEVSRKI